MKSTTAPSRATRRVTAALSVGALTAGVLLAGPTGTAAAADLVDVPAAVVSDATFTWGINRYVGSWLPGGTPGTQGVTHDIDNVQFLGAAGWQFSKGVGVVDADGVTTITFDATIDMRPYSGYNIPEVQILIDDPILTVNPDGSGELVAEIGSVGSSLNSTPIVSATLATFGPGSLGGTAEAVTFSTTPDYENTVPAGTLSPNQTHAFPLSFVNALDQSLRAFFHHSGSGRDAEKKALPITGAWSVSPYAPFADVADVDFADDIKWLAANGLATGRTVAGQDTPNFEPHALQSRQAMAAFFYRWANPGAAGGACAGAAPFTDVPASSAFCTEIAWAKEVGLLNGYADGTFHRSEPVSRRTFAAIAYRWMHEGTAAPACTEAPFTDVPATAQFCGEIAWLSTVEVADGFDDGTFRPAAPLDRKAMAAFIHRLSQVRLG